MMRPLIFLNILYNVFQHGLCVSRVVHLANCSPLYLPGLTLRMSSTSDAMLAKARQREALARRVEV